VQAPRLVLVILAADSLPVAPAAERGLLALAGIGTALVLTGGNLFLAHTVAQVEAWRRTLAAAWIAVLAASGGLVLPLIVSGLSARSVPQVLGAGRLAWTWALLAAVAHELTAAGCVLASAAWAATPAGASADAGAAAAGALPAAAAAGRGAHQRAEPLACPAGCGRSFAAAPALAGHLRHCAARRERLRRLAAGEP
jgi:hypothetical protein